MLNPVWLQTFKTLVETGHFTHTADKLFMTQPGVSQHVQKLESACGYPLLKRMKKTFELTPQGSQLYAYVCRLQQQEQAMLAQLGQDDPYAGQCELACSGALATLLYAPLLELQRQHPQLVISLEASPNQRILTEIKAGKLEMGIVTQQPDPLLFDSQIIGAETLSLVLPKQTTEAGETLSTALKRLGLIRHPDVDHYLGLYLKHSQQSELQKLSVQTLPTSGYVNQIHQILLPVAKGFGFTVLPQSAITSFTDKEALTVWPLEKPVQETLYLVWRKDREWPARYRTLVATLNALLNSD